VLSRLFIFYCCCFCSCFPFFPHFLSPRSINVVLSLRLCIASFWSFFLATAFRTRINCVPFIVLARVISVPPSSSTRKGKGKNAVTEPLPEGASRPQVLPDESGEPGRVPGGFPPLDTSLRQPQQLIHGIRQKLFICVSTKG